MAKQSPFPKPLALSPAPKACTRPASSSYVIVRPLGPSMSAGLSPNSDAPSNTKAVSGTSGMSTAGYGLTTTMLGSPLSMTSARVSHFTETDGIVLHKREIQG